jgi:hypothetical protein
MSWDEARALLPAHTQFSADSFAVASPFSAALRMIRNLISIGTVRGVSVRFVLQQYYLRKHLPVIIKLKKKLYEINSCKLCS